MSVDAAIYAGRVIHKRLRPKPHALDYGVFALLLDIDRIDETSARLRLFSRNRFNLLSFHDSDYGAGDGALIGASVRSSLEAAGRSHHDRRILALTYPRLFGYVFNPLTVFYVVTPDGDRLDSVVYEVSNTFGERTRYVLAAGDPQAGDVYAHACAKEMFVSPFASGHGRYAFRIVAPSDSALVAVLFSDAGGALIKTHFRASREPLTDGRIVANAIRFPLLTFKVIAAIHYEALKLWLKGVPLAARHRSPQFSTKPAAGAHAEEATDVIAARSS